MKKDLALIGGLILFIIVFVIFGGGFTSTSFIGLGKSSTESASTTTASLQDYTEVTIRALRVNTKVAATADLRKKGLSKHASIPVNEGILFVFDTSAKHAIWMKDMQFPIDIIWIGDLPSGEKKIVDIKESAAVQPKLQDKYLTIYKPHNDAKYILEINAGLARSNNLAVGDTVEFSI